MSDLELQEILASDNDSEETTDESRDQQTLRHIRDELLRYRPDIPEQNEDLRNAISEWLDAAFETRSGDIGEIVTQELHDVRTVTRLDADQDDDEETPAFSTYPMHDNRTVSSADEAFPDACKGCPNYGHVCPIFKDPRHHRELKRITEHEEGSEAVRSLRSLAMQNQCHVLKDILDTYESDLAPMLHAGVNLLMAAQDLISYNSTEEEVAKAVERARSASAALSPAGGQN